MNGLIDEQHRIDLLMWVDTVYMCKVMANKGFEPPEYAYDQQYTNTVFWTFIDELSRYTGRFSFTTSVIDDDTRQSIRLNLKPGDDEETLYRALRDAFENVDDFGSEVHTELSMGEVIIDTQGTFIFGRILAAVIEWLETMGAKFESEQTGGTV